MNGTFDATVGVLGVLLGFILSEVAARVRDAQAQRRQALALRAMLTHEIAHNRKRLQALWATLNPSGNLIEGESQQRAYAEQLAEQPGLRFGRDVLASQLPNLSVALDPAEIEAVFTLYDRFAQLDAIHQTLARLLAEQRGYQSGAPLPSPGAPPRLLAAAPFRDQAHDLWSAYQQTVVSILGQQPPLG